MWWKAIAGNRRGTVTDDGGFAYDLLPPWTRLVCSYPLSLLYPALHHQNVAIRTLFLDRAVAEALSACSSFDRPAPVVLVLGAGFDTRAARFAAKVVKSTEPTEPIDGPARSEPASPVWVELDLPAVVSQKRLFTARLKRRRHRLLKFFVC